MKQNTHPKYQDVLFVDSATGQKFVCGSTLQPEGKESYNGKEYPVYYLPISSFSHPFFTGSNQLADTEGRVKKFQNRYAAAQKKAAAPAEKKEAEAAPAKKAAKSKK